MDICRNRKRNIHKAGGIICFSLLVLVGGCTVGPDYARPDVEVPDQWHQAAAEGMGQGRADIQTWWDYFDDPLLNELIEKSCMGNLDIKQAITRVSQARALRAIAAGQQVPAIDAVGEFQRLRQSESITPTLGPGLSRTDNFYSTGWVASWEIDLWGRVRRDVESSDYSLHASIEDLRDVLVTLYAEVATNYVLARAFQSRIDFAEKNVERQKGSLVLTQARFKAGLVPELDVQQAKLNLATTKSRIPQLEEGLRQTMHRLGVLIGQEPYSLYETLEAVEPIPEPQEEITVGIPADLMRQRPDIRSAERQLASQTAQIGVATAFLYPQFTLNGDFLFESAMGSFAGIFSNRNIFWSFGPSFAWNIFDGNRITSNILLQEERTTELLFNYEQTILLALEDVSNAMVAYQQENDRRENLADSVAAAEKSVELVTILYRTGLTDFQNVLDMERSLFEQQDQLATSQGTVVINLISIYRALGGGWSQEG